MGVLYDDLGDWLRSCDVAPCKSEVRASRVKSSEVCPHGRECTRLESTCTVSGIAACITHTGVAKSDVDQPRLMQIPHNCATLHPNKDGPALGHYIILYLLDTAELPNGPQHGQWM